MMDYVRDLPEPPFNEAGRKAYMALFTEGTVFCHGEHEEEEYPVRAPKPVSLLQLLNAGTWSPDLLDHHLRTHQYTSSDRGDGRCTRRGMIAMRSWSSRSQGDNGPMSKRFDDKSRKGETEEDMNCDI
jgi:hypothetical protein